MPRRDALVSRFVENLASGMLEQYAPIIRQLVEQQHGVYALYDRDRLYYVGLATNLRGRLASHLRDRHKGLWDRFSVYPTINHGHIKELESLVIRIAQPKGNRQRGKFAKSENLAPSLRRLFLAHRNEEWAELSGKHATRRTVVKKRRGRRKATGAKSRRGQLAGRFTKAISLRGVHKGKTFKGRLRTDGTIRTGGETYESPSSAGAALVGHAVNGWWFWHYERAPGQWVRLRELRRK